MDRRLVDHLVNSEIVSRAAMQRMILRATKNKTGVVEQLLSDEKIDERSLAAELATYYGLETVSADRFAVNETALKFISKSMADKHGVLPFAVSDEADHLTVAVYNPESASSVVDSLKTATGTDPTVQVAPKSWLNGAIRHYYYGESWSGAPEHKAMTREVEVDDVSDDVGLVEESSEIVLDEVIVPPKPKRRKKKARAEKKSRSNTSPRRRASSAGGAEPKRRRNSHADADSEAEVEAALDDFDAFLDSATGWGNQSGAKIPGWDEDPADENPFAGGAAAPSGWQDQGGGGAGFSLFDNDQPAGDGPDPALRAQLDEQSAIIERLRRELQQQRDIISALVDALAESGVVSKREIKHRVKRK